MQSIVPEVLQIQFEPAPEVYRFDAYDIKVVYSKDNSQGETVTKIYVVSNLN